MRRGTWAHKTAGQSILRCLLIKFLLCYVIIITTIQSPLYLIVFTSIIVLNRESLVKDLESNLQQKKEDVARFEEERTDLIAKVQGTHFVTYYTSYYNCILD